MTAVSRRVALSCAAAGATTLICPLVSSAGAAERVPIRFLVVTDTHLGYRDQDSATQQWRRTAEELVRADGQFVLHLEFKPLGHEVAVKKELKR